MRRSSEGVLFL
jgi:ribonuclease HI